MTNNPAWTEPDEQSVSFLVDPPTYNSDLINNIAYLRRLGEPSLTNRSGGSLSAGAVVVADSANDSSFITTTTVDNAAVVGVVMETIADAANGRVANAGVVTVNVQGNVTRGNYLRTSATAGRAEDAGASPTQGSFAIALTAYAGGGAGTVTAILLPSPKGAGGVELLDYTAAENKITNTTTETDLYSVAIPANKLGTSNMVRMVCIGRVDNDTASRNLTVRVKYGATTILTPDNPMVLGFPENKYYILEVWLFADGATNAQEAFYRRGSATDNTTGAPKTENNIAVENSTTQLNLKVTGQWSTAAAVAEFTRKIAWCEYFS